LDLPGHVRSTAVLGFPLLALGFGLFTASTLCERGILSDCRVFGATMGATLAYSIYLTHKEIMHLDRMYLGTIVKMDSVLGLAVYVVTILIAAVILHLCVERPFLRLRDRILGHASDETREPVGASLIVAK
jgi:peptidoglycan/LPS O-acetylase OafA/YrhL